MTQEQYEQHKRRLDEQLRTGIQILESAHQAQVRALDLVWMLQAEEISPRRAAEAPAVSSPQPPPPPPPAKREALPEPERPRRRGPGELEDDIRAALLRLPGQFTRSDVCAALGYDPDRGTLYRILQELVHEGRIGVGSVGSGRRATVYSRTDAPH